MSAARPVVAVIPFGARGASPRPGAWARQMAARLVERFAGNEAVDVRPVFLVAMPETTSDAGYLVFGSSPDAGLAAEYGRSLGATYALTGTYREDGSSRRLEATLGRAALMFSFSASGCGGTNACRPLSPVRSWSGPSFPGSPSTHRR